VTYFPYPALLTALQYLTSVIGVVVAGWTGVISHDKFVWTTARRFFPAAFVFYLAIFANTNLLKHANVDTFIVFRSTTPLLVAIADTLFRGQPLPSGWTFASLFVILGGAVGYVATDSQFTITAYSWAFTYLIVICTEMVYVKKMVMDIELNTWGFVFYNNLISLLLSPFFWLIMGEYKMLMVGAPALENGVVSVMAVGLSCIFGVAISFFGFAARKAISATAFTVTGVVNKLLTVVVNVMIWDKHASSVGLASLLVTIVGGVLYQQSTTNPKGANPVATLVAAAAPEETEEGDDEEKGSLLAPEQTGKYRRSVSSVQR
jgi:GDP-mannose transporter